MAVVRPFTIMGMCRNLSYKVSIHMPWHHSRSRKTRSISSLRTLSNGNGLRKPFLICMVEQDSDRSRSVLSQHHYTHDQLCLLAE
jgi:hypothetical protein